MCPLPFELRIYKKFRRTYIAMGSKMQRSKKTLMVQCYLALSREVYRDLRLKSARELIDMGFDGYALGGLSVGEPKSIMWEMIDAVVDLLPQDKPKYLMGVGFPEDIIEGVYRGIDMFDCVILTRHARNGSLFTGRQNKHQTCQICQG